MKKLLSLCLVLLCLSASALAAEEDQDGPLRWMFGTDAEYTAALELWQAEQAAAEPEPEPPPPESAGESDGDTTALPMDPGVSDKYPLGSFVDAAGNVWAPDGALLSQRTLSALPDATEAPQETAPPLAPDPSSPAPPDALAPVYSITDLRPASDPSVLSGLKALISSIFGEYTPVTTTAVITETVGENVNQYLVETVAPGAAGVDYEWLAGVFLFGILLFCLMKLLGGVLK